MTATCCNAATSPLGQWRSIVMFSRTSAIPPNSGRVFAGRSWHGMCHSGAVDYSIGAAGSPSGGPNARHNCTAIRYRRILIGYFGGRFLMSVASAPKTMNIAVSNGRSHCPALLVSLSIANRLRAMYSARPGSKGPPRRRSGGPHRDSRRPPWRMEISTAARSLASNPRRRLQNVLSRQLHDLAPRGSRRSTVVMESRALVNRDGVTENTVNLATESMVDSPLRNLPITQLMVSPPLAAIAAITSCANPDDKRPGIFFNLPARIPVTAKGSVYCLVN